MSKNCLKNPEIHALVTCLLLYALQWLKNYLNNFVLNENIKSIIVSR